MLTYESIASSGWNSYDALLTSLAHLARSAVGILNALAVSFRNLVEDIQRLVCVV